MQIKSHLNKKDLAYIKFDYSGENSAAPDLVEDYHELDSEGWTTRLVAVYRDGRRLDFAVIKDGKVQGLYEVTSPTANKNAQQFKEQFIRDNGGIYIKDRQTGNLIDVSKKPTERVNID